MSASKKQSPFLNRELSWLEFNQRVLDEAANENVPLLDRLTFTAITSRNLDEFVRVRVGGLTWQQSKHASLLDPSGLTAAEQLDAVHTRMRTMVSDQYKLYNDTLSPLLSEINLTQRRLSELDPAQKDHVEHYFETELFPTLTPMILESGPDQPVLCNQLLYVGIRIKREGDDAESRTAVLPLNPAMPRTVPIPAGGHHDYVLVDDIIVHYIDRFFPGETILEAVRLRISRNADMAVSEDFAANLLSEMENVLAARRSSACTRLEIEHTASRTMIAFLKRALNLADAMITTIDGPLDLSYLMDLARTRGLNSHRYDDYPPQPSPDIDQTLSMFNTISQQDILLQHPYHSFEPVVRFIEEAAHDPGVIAIKQILYRTSSDSRVVDALIEAARQGKMVTVLVELKARFDEARNVERAHELEAAGAQVIYGIKNYKTHAKLCIVMRREPRGIVRYMHFGTGNYNETTARLYTDISYLTCNPELGSDASTFFNTICGYSQPQAYHHLHAAPISLRDHLLSMIASETERARQGRKAHIMVKINSLVDEPLIEALYAASQAGVKIELNIRGICCLRPGVKGLSENISVISIIDRFLEHSRIFYCLHGGEERLYISSADWMPRNLDRRIELLIPILDPTCHKQLLANLCMGFKDDQKARKQSGNGSYKPPTGARSKKPVRSQASIYDGIVKQVERTQKKHPSYFEPHRPPTKGIH